jgi:hypothetical protein
MCNIDVRLLQQQVQLVVSVDRIFRNCFSWLGQYACITFWKISSIVPAFQVKYLLVYTNQFHVRESYTMYDSCAIRYTDNSIIGRIANPIQ